MKTNNYFFPKLPQLIPKININSSSTFGSETSLKIISRKRINTNSARNIVTSGRFINSKHLKNYSPNQSKCFYLNLNYMIED